MSDGGSGAVELLVVASLGVTAAVAEAVRRREAQFEVETVRTATGALDLLEDADFDCVVSGVDAGETDALGFLTAIRKRDVELPFLVVADGEHEVTASDALDAGVTDYVRARGSEGYDELAVRVERAVAATGRRAVDPSLVYERVFEQILEGACLYDRDGRFVLVSDYLAGFYGATPAELEGERSLLVERIREERTGDPYQQLLDGEVDCLEGETELVTPDGESRTLSYRFAPFRVTDEVVGVIAVSRDITDRREREQKLKRAREEYQELIDGMNDTVWVIDIDSHILAVNETAVELLGYSRDELLSMTVHDIDAGLSDEEASALISQMPTDGTQVFETVHRAKNGREFPVEISSSLVTYRGETVVLSVARDITTRKRYEAELREQNRLLETQRDELEVLNQVVRHDVRNDLQLVTAYAELLAERVDDDDNEAREYVEIVRKRANHAVELTETARDMAEMMGGRGVENERVPLRPVLESELASLRDMAPDATVTVNSEIPAVAVLADDMLGSVFRNLLTNAVQHTDKDEPTVDISVSETERGDRVVVRVADDGRGVSDERKEAIFAKDEKGLESRGTGLGLYLVQSLVETYGGDVWVEDNDPCGSVFAVELRTADEGQDGSDQSSPTRS
ncbi:hybrid sensor histidine kinase/response regulator [Haloferax sp. Atlit-10N]|uniref:PAS domain S-box protein n=1 Tax=unclassified Haloferax TaxID=2625095 RepID=UPI000E266B7D|nr:MULTISPECIES: PAS domain S-box protein [unclassified Haloferax]RDZ44231.1 hybrid sensor histidine kinase/response regulator [Haloferax sp. Atlit-16N]RDZ58275.1 hybrid sensor histidine kinase/response regulator [Haloferax sp. Atlit-10N]